MAIKSLEQEISRRIDDLPSISPAVLKLIQIIDLPKTTRDDVLKLITLDQVLFANAFKYANSAAIGAVKRLTSLTEIIDILGFNIIKNIAILSSLKKAVVNKNIWSLSVFLGISAKAIAKKLNLSNKDAEDLYMAGLLLTYGSFALSYFYPELYKEINPDLDLEARLNAEKNIFGINHLELSAMILRKWGLPESVTNIIESHALIASYSTNNHILALSMFIYKLHQTNQAELLTELNHNPSFSHLQTINSEFEITEEFITQLFSMTEELLRI